MKQGMGNSKPGSTKIEPLSKAVNPGAVGNMGLQVTRTPQQMYEGRGLKAPMVSSTSHPKGSQGKH